MNHLKLIPLTKEQMKAISGGEVPQDTLDSGTSGAGTYCVTKTWFRKDGTTFDTNCASYTQDQWDSTLNNGVGGYRYSGVQYFNSPS